MLSHRAFALAWPCRTAASSITSSWYSVARWVSSMAIAPGTSRSSGWLPNWRGQQDQRGPQPLAARDQVRGGLVEQRLLDLHRFPQACLDLGQPVGDDLFQRRVGKQNGDNGRH